MKKVIKAVLCLFCFLSAVLAIPMAFVVKPGFSMAGNSWPISLFAVLLGFPLTYYFWPFANHMFVGGARRKNKDDEKKSWETEEHYKERMGKKGVLTICGGGVAIIFLLFPYIWGVEYIKFCNHEDRVEISEVAIVEKGWSESHDEYAIDFTVDLEIDKYEAYAVDIHVLIYKGDEFIGWLPVTLNGIEHRYEDGSEYSVFPANEKHTMTFSFLGGRNLATADELFQEVWYGDEDDYTFVTKFMGVGFIDGTDVGYLYMDFQDYTYNTNDEEWYGGQNYHANTAVTAIETVPTLQGNRFLRV